MDSPKPDPGLLDRDGFISSEELSEYLGVPVTTLDVWASRGGGPIFHKFSKYRRYLGADVKAWIKTKRQDVGEAA